MEQLLSLGEYIILGFATPTMTKELDKDTTRQELLTTTRTIGQFFFTIHIPFTIPQSILCLHLYMKALINRKIYVYRHCNKFVLRDYKKVLHNFLLCSD